MNGMMDPDALAMRSEARTVSVNRIYNFVYGWMAVGLAISGVVAWVVANAVRAGAFPIAHLWVVCALVEVGLVMAISWGFRKLSPLAAAVLFAIFAAVNGMTLSVVLLVYSVATVQLTFFITAGMFAGMALIGTLCERSLSGIGRICVMALWGVILASVVNWFLRSSALDFGISLIGVVLFSGLTAWDAQKVKLLAEQEGALDGATVRKLGILCALELYLDFVNLFLYLLRLMGNRRN
ncbi:MAG: Bax inhibitor-1/YccA family protein [Candidatus Spyradenecus sp.]